MIGTTFIFKKMQDIGAGRPVAGTVGRGEDVSARRATARVALQAAPFIEKYLESVRACYYPTNVYSKS